MTARISSRFQLLGVSAFQDALPTRAVLLGSPLLAAVNPANGETKTWTGATDVNWTTANNWSPGEAPASSTLETPVGVGGDVIDETGLVNYSFQAPFGSTNPGRLEVTGP